VIAMSNVASVRPTRSGVQTPVISPARTARWWEALSSMPSGGPLS